QFDGVAQDDALGFSVAGAGDVNGDGRDDAIVGAPGDDTGGALAGRVRVYSGLDGAVLFDFTGDEPDRLGIAVAGAGGLDGDGRPDIVAGADYGFVRAWSGADGTVFFTVPGPNLGTSVAGAGSVNGDCFAELVAGDPVQSGAAGEEVGHVFVFSLVGQAE